jgi:hypothetical protein
VADPQPTKETSVSHRISLRRAVVSAGVAASLLAALVPSMAGAATPRAGYYSGDTSQTIAPSDPTQQAEPGSVGFKVFKYGSFSGPVRKVLSVTVNTQLTCASGEVREDLYTVYIIMGGKINKYGKFRYVGNGLSIRGRFGTKTSARGTFTRTVGDCKAENVSWSAKRKTGGLPIPS